MLLVSMLLKFYSLLGLFDMPSFNQDPLGQLSVIIPSVAVPISASSVDAAATDTNVAVLSTDGSNYTLKQPIDGSYDQVMPKWRRNSGIVSTGPYK